MEDRRRAVAALLRAGGGVALGHRPGEAWHRNRFAAPYLRDELLDRGVLVETLETATSWSSSASCTAASARRSGARWRAEARRRS